MCSHPIATDHVRSANSGTSKPSTPTHADQKAVPGPSGPPLLSLLVELSLLFLLSFYTLCKGPCKARSTGHSKALGGSEAENVARKATSVPAERLRIPAGGQCMHRLWKTAGSTCAFSLRQPQSQGSQSRKLAYTSRSSPFGRTRLGILNVPESYHPCSA